MALSGESKRKMITAFSPLFSTKAYRYSTLIPCCERTARRRASGEMLGDGMADPEGAARLLLEKLASFYTSRDHAI